MFSASIGGRDAAARVYRHALVRLLIPLLRPLATGHGWSDLACALGAVLMGWNPAPTLAQRFDSTLAVLDAGLPRRRRVGRTYQGFIKALARHSERLRDTLGEHLRALTRQTAGKQWRVGEFVPIGVDGSKIDAPRTTSNEALGFAGKDKCGPQMMLLLLVHLGVMLPWTWRIGKANDPERTLLRQSLDMLPANTLLVADAGFTGFDLLRTLQARGVSFLVRVGSGVHLLRDLGFYRREGGSTVYLWPEAHRSSTPLRLRLIHLGNVYLITDVTDPRRLSQSKAVELYRRRWGLEVAFRSLKQTLERRKVRSGAAANARLELDWSLVGLWLLGLLGVRAIVAAGHGPRRLSLAQALTAVRWAQAKPQGDCELRGRLRKAVLDGYRRRASKQASRWPHKKNPKPPGAPVITIANAVQVRRAQELRPRTRAA